MSSVHMEELERSVQAQLKELDQARMSPESDESASLQRIITAGLWD